MNTHSSLDRKSFQELLANAFAVQESGLDTQSLATIVELQRLISTGEPDVDRAMRLVADRSRTVANATGIAVALLEAGQLIYRAGTGSAAPFVGRHVTAILSVSESSESRGEILRVENAQTDSRIEADVCRQFESQSLLILPIYHERALAGVLEVFFDEEHVFQDREVRAYRLMARLVEEAMSRSAQIVREKAPQEAAPLSPPLTAPQSIEPFPSWMQTVDDDHQSSPRLVWIDQLRRAGTALAGKFWFAKTAVTQRLRGVPARLWLTQLRETGAALRGKFRFTETASTITQRLRSVSPQLWINPLRRRGSALAGRLRFAERAATTTKRLRTIPLPKLRPTQLRQKQAVAAMACTLVAAACVIAYSRSGHPASLAGGPSARTSTDAPQHIPFAPAKTEDSAPAVQNTTVETEPAKPSNLAFRRVRVGRNEVDYIAADVTIRHFVTKSALPRTHAGYKQVNIGNDVTVRYFPPKPTTVSQSR